LIIAIPNRPEAESKVWAQSAEEKERKIHIKKTIFIFIMRIVYHRRG
jgi:hypothetical protein